MMKYMKKIWSVLLLAVLLLAVGCDAAWAYTDVTPTEHPKNVRIHLFDYQVEGDSDDNKDPSGKTTASVMGDGINAGHGLLFTPSHETAYGWYNGLATGQLVKSYLNKEGYPVLDLDKGNDVHRTGWKKSLVTFENATKNSGATANESLKYLFEKSPGTNREYYSATNLLLRDGNRYYFTCRPDSDYSNTAYFAEFKDDDNDGKGAFNLYTGVGSADFFPFNSPSGYSILGSNHYFGMLVEVDFYLPKEFKEEDNFEFKFTGDDDVFVFVDNLLVGSVGGIHGPRDLTIDFKTGVVTEGRDCDGNNTQLTDLETTSIYAYYNKAKAQLKADGLYSDEDEAAQKHLPQLRNVGTKENAQWTLEANTKHTLRMYYLERGHHNSILSLSFNLPAYLPNGEYTLSNTVTGGNALLDVPFTYDMTFDMSEVIANAVTNEVTYKVVNASGKVLERGKATLSGEVNSKTIASVKVVEDDAETDKESSYLDGGKPKLKNGEKIIFTLPDLTKVTSKQIMPDTPDRFSVSPYEFVSLTITPELETEETTPPGSTPEESMTGTGKIEMTSDSGSVSAAYVNKILTSTITVKKTVSGTGAPTTDNFTFKVTGLDPIEQVSGVEYPTDNKFTLQKDGSQVLTVIRDAQFTVQETGYPAGTYVQVSGGAQCKQILLKKRLSSKITMSRR